MLKSYKVSIQPSRWDMDMGGRLQFLILCAAYILTTEETILNSDNNDVGRKCTKCPPGWGVARPCTPGWDTQCVRCAPGASYSSHHSSKSPCWLCSRCGVGLYESHRCSPHRDTICSECVVYLDNKNVSRSGDFLEKCSYLFLA